MTIIKRNESGQGLTEYIVLLLLVCVVSITAVKTLGTRVKSKLAEASNHINSELTLKDGSSSGGSSGNGGGTDGN
jgi:Flp pilus assembly pilin Flp